MIEQRTKSLPETRRVTEKKDRGRRETEKKFQFSNFTQSVKKEEKVSLSQREREIERRG